MKRICHRSKFFVFATAIIFCSCIHDYPHGEGYPNGPSGPNSGVDPTSVNLSIDVSFDLSWQNIIHHIDFSTRRESDNSHRFILEVKENANLVCRDIIYISDAEFANGKITHKLSQKLGKLHYDLAVWYDYRDEEGNFSFDSQSLDKISLTNFSTVDNDNLRCGYASDNIDLSNFSSSEKESNYTKKIELQHAVARFEIIATDIQQFITNQKEALNQGDYFTSKIYLHSGAFDNFGIFSKEVWTESEIIQLSGKMRLPFAEYDKLKIAEGTIFCKEEDEIKAKLEVINSALFPVVETYFFYFPVKRGFVTTIEGDFLSETIDGVFSIDNIWDGEIYYDIDE